MTLSPLLRSLFKEPDETLYAVVEEHLRNGQDPNAASPYGETPLKQAYRRGRMDVFSLLLDHGADASDLRWTPLHRAVALGSPAEVRAAAQDADMSAREISGLTPFLLACDLGDMEKAAMLLPLSRQHDRYRTYHREPALVVAARKGRTEMVRWLLANGFDANETDEFGGTALIAAAESDRPEIVKILLEAGAEITARYDLSAAVRNIDRVALGLAGPPDTMVEHAFFDTAASQTGSAAVARLLIAAGAEPCEFDNDVLRELTGAVLIPEQEITPSLYEAQRHPRFGTANPEPVACEFWLEMIRTGESAYSGHERHGSGPESYGGSPTWSFDRFGMSTTPLPGDAWVQIAGEHEDHYDPDFCIYNDVVVHDGKGGVGIFIYPRDVFPPTDFHTATVIDHAIILIGNLGYREDRRPGRTQVLRLNLRDFSIERVDTSGTPPGWISRHRALLDGDRIVVRDGKLWDGADYVAMDGAYALSPASGVWTRLDRA